MSISAEQAAKLLEGTTPGPWQAIGWNPCGIFGRGGLADAIRIAGMDQRLEHDANAALIAAAPDLAAALIASEAARKLAEVQRLREELAERHALHLEQVRITSEWIAERDAALARVEKLREALRMSLEGWENVLELDLLTRSRRHSAKTMATVARAALDEDERHA